MESRVCLVTGATSGIGREAARQLAAQGATVIIVGRDPAKTRTTKEAIGAADYLLGDLSTREGVSQIASAFRSRYSQLHVLINCAGAIYGERTVTNDGLEMGFALNHLAYFQLTNLLLDRLIASAPARILNVTSGYHSLGQIDFDNLQLERGYSGTRSYGQSKLANVLFTYELARRLQGTGVTVNCMTPGAVATNFGANWALNTWFFRLFGRFFHTPEQAGGMLVHLATAPELEGVTGQYYRKTQVGRSKAISYDRALQAQMWRVSEQLTGL